MKVALQHAGGDDDDDDDDELVLCKVTDDENASNDHAMVAYKVFLKCSPNLAVYAQLDYNKSSSGNNYRYCLDREDEVALMERLLVPSDPGCWSAAQKEHPCAVPALYSCHEVPEGGKLWLTEWIGRDDDGDDGGGGGRYCCQSWALQLVQEDATKTTTAAWHLLLPKLAKTLARLHTTTMRHQWEDRRLAQHVYARQTDLREILPRAGSLATPPLTPLENGSSHPQPQDEEDRVSRLVKELGEHVCSIITGAMINDFHRNECIIHSDVHLFNVMVVEEEQEQQQPHENYKSTNDNFDVGSSSSTFDEKKIISFACLNSGGFSSNKSIRTSRLVIPRWKTARPGPIGRDLGLAIAWPIACFFWHTNQGRDDITEELMDFVQAFWDEYANARRSESCRTFDDNQPLGRRMFRNMVAWCGWFLYVEMYQRNAYMHHFRFAGSQAEKDRSIVLESIGIVGLTFMHLGFFAGSAPNDLSVEDWKAKFIGTIQDEKSRLRDVVIVHPRSSFPSLQQLEQVAYNSEAVTVMSVKSISISSAA